MCGIVGCLGNKIIDITYLNRIQKHRGPDFQSQWEDDFAVLGHQRLSIVDLNNRSNQPLKKGNFIIVYNGEIYNYKELRTHLKNKLNIEFITQSDTEVILEMYRLYKEKCLDYFLGMFSFAIYDVSNSSTFLARDHFGIKPLFYSTIGNSFVFASELKTLIKIQGFDKSINIKSMVSCINYQWVSGNETMFSNCFKLPPAHYMIVDKELNISVNSYWSLSEIQSSKSEQELVSELQSAFEKSINRHMVSDVDVSAFLSGGLDSSLIAVLAKRKNSKLSTYTIATTKKDKLIEKMPDDELYAKKLADLNEFDHNEIIIDSDIVKYLPSIVRTLDEPIGDPAAINTYLICKKANDNGVKVMLSGMGADELFFGYRRQKATIYGLKYKKIPLPISSFIKSIINFLPVEIYGRGIKSVRWAKRFLSFASLPLEKSYMQSYSYYSNEELKDIFLPRFHQGIIQIYEEHKKIFDDKFADDIVNRICHTDINMFMQGLNLTYTDRASMAASVEIRVPFIDKEIVELAMRIPGNYKYNNGESKSILKKMAEKYLPHEIIYRPKSSFGAPIRSWISSDLRPMVDELLSRSNIQKRGFFQYQYIEKLINDDRSGKEDNAYRIYQLLTLELWCREFLD